MKKPILTDNNTKFIELILQEVRKIDEKALFKISYFPNNIRIEIQSKADVRSSLFNKLRALHKLYGVRFRPSQFIKKANTLISIELSCVL